MTEEDERRYQSIRGAHGQVARSGEQPHCGWCGTIWPCHAAFLLGVIDAMEAEGVDMRAAMAEREAALLASGWRHKG